MADKKTKLELTWIGKENRPRLEPRILLEDPALSYHAKKHVTDHDLFDNMLIQGDNLLALKALERQFAGKVKCVYIDPPYNTGSAFKDYDDGIEHSIWLSLMRDRLELLRRLLAVDGSIWISIDDAEMPYLRVLMDEVFGRHCFIASNVWQKRYSRENREAIGDVHEYVLVYALDVETFKKSRNLIPIDEKSAAVYKNPNNDPKGRWRGIPMTAQGWRTNQMYPITTPSGVIHRPPEGRCWSTTENNYKALLAEGRIWFGRNGSSQPSVIRYLTEVEGMVPWTWWTHDECGHTDEAKKEIHELFGKLDAFDTPKPERLLKRVFDIATNPGDLVLDSFAGSGTSGAVAHKMGRRWIMVELGDHAQKLVASRMKNVVEGADPGGITDVVSWNGGGGFRFYRLAPSLLERDKWDNWVVNKQFNKEMLAEAMCKLEGFTYAPSSFHFWMHGQSTERDFIYVTTQFLTHEQLAAISDVVGPGRTLLICCSAYRAKPDQFVNLTLKKIPAAVLSRCEWGHDDYSLNVASLVGEEPTAPSEPSAPGARPVARSRRKPKAVQEFPLFEQKGKQ